MSVWSLGRHWQYLRYVLIHKWYVFRAGCTLGIPWLAVLHDNSKFRPDEFLPYARHFYEPDGSKRTRKAADGFFRDQPDDATFDRAWLKHIRRNKHHPQHWVRVRSARCQCSEVPSHIQHQYGYIDRNDVLLKDDGGAQCMSCFTRLSREQLRCDIREMPRRYRLEMLADWIGAGQAQGTPDTLGWYTVRGKHHPLGPETRAWIEQRLGYLASPSQPSSTTPPC
jgi:hypothetical protein